jgi:hypothetical protein
MIHRPRKPVPVLSHVNVWVENGAPFSARQIPTKSLNSPIEEPPVVGPRNYQSGVRSSQGFPFMSNRTEPKTPSQWLRYILMAAVALFLVWWMLQPYIL